MDEQRGIREAPQFSIIEYPGLLESFLDNLKEFLRARKLKLSDASEHKLDLGERLYRKQFRLTGATALLLHFAAILLLLFAPTFFGQKELGEETVIEFEVVENIGPYQLPYPVGKKKISGGGGGGGARNPLPASEGKLPERSLLDQLTPITVIVRNENPKLTAEPTVMMPPDIESEKPNASNYGDPASSSLTPSSGPGAGGGGGGGQGGGIDDGFGPGFGPGRGGGFGGGIFKIGGDVSAPTCIYCPDPEYSEEARKARHSGAVVLWAIIDKEGKVRDSVRVQKSLGLGLDEEAIRAVMNWQFKPAERFGKSVPVYLTIEINFRLL